MFERGIGIKKSLNIGFPFIEEITEFEHMEKNPEFNFGKIKFDFQSANAFEEINTITGKKRRSRFRVIAYYRLIKGYSIELCARLAFDGTTSLKVFTWNDNRLETFSLDEFRKSQFMWNKIYNQFKYDTQDGI